MIRKRMNRPRLIRAVFLELRRALGSSLAAGEILRLAASLVSAYATPDPREEEWDLADTDPLFRKGVDGAMSDGGWAVLELAVRNGLSLDDWPDGSRTRDLALKNYVGTAQWQGIGTV